MLHGGVSRPKWKRGGRWWRGGRKYHQYKPLDRITVFPAAWNRAVWWNDKQADNLPEILRQLKKIYHIDDNRVYLSGVSDGGTGTYFFAYIGHPSVLISTQEDDSHRLALENLTNAALYIVNGEKDRLYPVSSIIEYIGLLKKAKINHSFTAIKGGKHNTKWMSDETPKIEQFKRDNPRDPLPDNLSWVADRVDRYNGIAWIRIDKLDIATNPGKITASRSGNVFSVTSEGIASFTLFLHPEEINFDQPVEVNVNGKIRFNANIEQNSNVLLNWAEKRDKTQLFTAELKVRIRK